MKSSIKKILVVDDNQPNRLVAGLMLEMLGYGHENAASGAEALARIANTKYDVVLMDVQMPELDGLETARRIRAMEKDTQRVPVPIIAVTADVGRIYEGSCVDAGMNAFIVKPYTSQKLGDTINGFLAQRPEGEIPVDQRPLKA